MPYTKNKGVRIYWEEEGSGEPLLMIMGLSFSLAMWGELRGILTRHFRAILLDNRGAGKSAVPLHLFSIPEMASDAACVLDAAGVQSTDVIGLSMGGMIAQELTLRHPERVRRLVLGCTLCGGPNAVPPDKRAMHALRFPFMTRERRLRAMLPLIYHPQTPKERIDRDVDILRRNKPSVLGYLLQFGAILKWDSYESLPSIQSPTLVMHGDSDGLIPVANARIIASRIPGAKLVIIPDASHLFPVDQPEITRNTLLDFLAGAVANPAA